MRRAGFGLIVAILAGAIGAPWLAPYGPDGPRPDLQFAPPTVPHVVDADGHWHAPFIYPWHLVSRLEQRYEPDESTRVPITWFTHGHLVGSADDVRAPLLLLGADSYGRDVFSRLLYGARLSLGVAAVAALGALLVGALVGGLAGYAGGAVDELLMRSAEFLLVLPAIYVILALRSVMPLVLPASTVFLLLAGILSLIGSPFVAQGVRAIVAAERRREYYSAAVAAGAGHARLLFRHLLPAARGFLAVELTVLLPAFVLAEATLSYVGMGFPGPSPSWGAMLREASNVSAIADFPWVLAPAVAIVLVVLGLNLILQGSGANPIALPTHRPASQPAGGPPAA
ncbi:MAG: ABC transporter permease [Acidobacteriota bacterium]|nr:ABC transporter permease [Acidobacteriota bacterium]